MARSHLAVALATATILLLVTFHLISTYDLPRFGYLHLHNVFEGTNEGSSHQIPISPPLASHESSEDPSRYLLGVGKADITGYVRAFHSQS